MFRAVTSRAPSISSISWRFPSAGTRAARVLITAHSSPYHVFHPTPKFSGLVHVQVNYCMGRQIWHAQRGVAPFHSSGPNQGLPLIPMLLGAFKASTTIEVARTAARIALTFLPLILFKNRWSKKYLKHHDKFHPGTPVNEEKKAALLKRIRARTLVFNVLLFVPVTLFWLAILASAEQTPITGRWRLIILSPEEEDEIAAQLKGPNWYHAVTEILSIDGQPKLIPATDWRYQWVRDTLRRLEVGIPILQREQELASHWLDTTPDQPPLPPPAEYPLRPRPRATDTMRRWSEGLCGRSSPHSAHVIAGPPYSLLIVDKPDAANAFSYGFGPDGACGIVVYSGFIDNILSKAPCKAFSSDYTPQSLPEESSWWEHLFGSLFISPLSTLPPHPVPTEQQTAELAILLAHEVAHLVLSHHLETLSSVTIMVPALISMFADFTRTLLFPVTMLFGPFVNDAVAQLGKVGSGELTKIGEYCTSVNQEIEADVVSARILAHAGFDARQAVAFWEHKQNTPQAAECSLTSRPETSNSSWALTRQIMGSSHPVNEVRIEKLKSELVRWELEKRVAEKKRIVGEPERSSILAFV
ncbi:peptidase family M48-domain-containing protein [Suillus plorans]|uniref:Peptidase family M48-domain-containing protein n=1 Tax=Suillus plorans TaxID=116603 RepID=A0A9P7DML6_9AGAM|nr:peptidase family M48-domain-containing protein [Suillus plorans]KAG1798534.1 peptidase family M48-domain-containing protein [Suillus plorans]